MFRIFQIIAYFPDSETRPLLKCFAFSRLLRIFQIIAHFPDLGIFECSANSRKFRSFQIVSHFQKDFSVFAIISQNPVSHQDKKTQHLEFGGKLNESPYFTALSPQTVRIIFKVRLGVFDIKVNFKDKYSPKLCNMEWRHQNTFCGVLTHRA